MGVLTVISTMKSAAIKAEAMDKHQPIIPSPTLSSNDSGTVLLPGQQGRFWPKKKNVSWIVGSRIVPSRVSNFMWSGLFLMVIMATVVIVATLADNIRKTLWIKSTQDEPRYERQILYPQTSHLGTWDLNFSDCTRPRMNPKMSFSFRSKWSAIVDQAEERCLLFDLHRIHLKACPESYPWDMDIYVGVPPCRGPLAKIAPIRKIMHHICSQPPLNLTTTGNAISTMCASYKILQVDKVIIHYFDRSFKRVARQSGRDPNDRTAFSNLRRLPMKSVSDDDQPDDDNDSNGIFPTQPSQDAKPAGILRRIGRQSDRNPIRLIVFSDLRHLARKRVFDEILSHDDKTNINFPEKPSQEIARNIKRRKRHHLTNRKVRSAETMSFHPRLADEDGNRVGALPEGTHAKGVNNPQVPKKERREPPVPLGVFQKSHVEKDGVPTLIGAVVHQQHTSIPPLFEPVIAKEGVDEKKPGDTYWEEMYNLVNADEKVQELVVLNSPGKPKNVF